MLQPVQFSSSLGRSGVGISTLQEVNREYRRVSHITAEQRRRGSIKVSAIIFLLCAILIYCLHECWFMLKEKFGNQ